MNEKAGEQNGATPGAMPAEQPGLSRAARQLHAQLEGSPLRKLPAFASFWAKWDVYAGPDQPIDTWAAFAGLCAQPDGPYDALTTLRDVVEELRRTGALATPDPKLRSFILQLTWALMERITRDRAGAVSQAVDGGWSVCIDDELAAHVAATGCVDAGMLVDVGDDGHPFVSNVVTELPHALPSDAGDGELLDAAQGELLLLAGQLRRGGQPLLKQACMDARVRRAGTVSRQTLKAELRQLERSRGVKPAFVVKSGSGGALAASATVRGAIKREFGVDVLLHAGQEGAAAEHRAAVQQLTGDIRHYLGGIMAALGDVDSGKAVPARGPTANSIFISYAHADGGPWLARLQTHLQGLELQASPLDVWDDRRLEAGDNWFAEITNAISRARLAILILTESFLASKFIKVEEVPRLLQREVSAGLRIIPLLASQCVWEKQPMLQARQIRPLGAKSLEELQDAERTSAFKDLALEVFNFFNRQP